MPSDDSLPPDFDDLSQGDKAPRTEPRAERHPPVPLRREAVLMSSERQRGTLIAVCFSLAGLGFGFGMGQMASASNSHCAHDIQIRHQETRAQAPAPAPVPVQEVTWLGVEVASAYGSSGGAHVVNVVPGSPAEFGGLDVGDTIISLGGTPVHDSLGLVRAVRAREAGDSVTVILDTGDGDRSSSQFVLGSISHRDLRQLGR